MNREEQMDVLTKIKRYKNRQVVINCYDEEDSLIDRNGFHFDSIQTDNERVMFLKHDELIYSFSLIEFPESKIMNDFTDYYAFYNKHNRICIYFPH